MEKFIIKPSGPLNGVVKINGSKNAILPIICASLLTKEECIINEVPPLTDVLILLEIIKNLGAEVDYNEQQQQIKIKCEKITNCSVEYNLANKLRASFLVMGALLNRNKKAIISLPGGCKIGTRPVDLHLKGFSVLGATVKQESGYISVKCKKLIGNHIYLDFPSVGATENIMIGASGATGTTIIENAAIEPEIIDLGNFLNKLGAEISFCGVGTIMIKGTNTFKGAEHTVIPDRIEAGTFMAASAVTGGNITLKNVEVEHLGAIISKLTEAGVKVVENGNSINVYSENNFNSIDIKTMPFPGFPTDLQAIFMALNTVAKGRSVITETVFENRFMHISELNRMGANIKTEGRVAVVEGVNSLMGSAINASDLRAGAALVIAALCAKGDTEIGEIHHIERGYFKLDEKLNSLGANIKRL